MQESQRDPLTFALVADYKPGLISRKLDLYRFFQNKPRIVLVRRGGLISLDPRILIDSETIRLPIVALEEKKRLAQANLSAFGYLAHAFFLPLKFHWKKRAIQLVHAHFILPQGLFGLILARLCRVPFVVSVAGGDVNDIMRKSAALRVICRYILSHADATIAVSRPLQKSLRRFGITKSVYLPNSVDTSAISPSDEPYDNGCILFVGTMTRVKRPLLLVDAFEKVTALVANARLIMVGDGPLLKQVQDRILQKRLESRVQVIPSTPPKAVIKLLSRVAVFVLPSESEGLNNTLLEAMAAGKAIVASDNESNRNILQHGTNALLFRLDDETDLAEKIEALLRDGKLRSKLSRSARELCLEKFSAMKIGPKLEDLYQALILNR